MNEPIEKKSSAFHHLHRIVSKHHAHAKQKFEETHKKAIKTLKKHGRTLDEIRVKGALAASTAAIASMLATTPVAVAEDQPIKKPEADPNKEIVKAEQEKKAAPPTTNVPDTPEVFAQKLRNVLGNKSTFTPEDEQALSQVISEHFGIKAVAELEGNRLNKIYGLVGGEQHLPRYPGDTAAAHYTEGEDIYPTLSGITPGRGAWGYYSQSKETLTDDLYTKERYYLVGQTFLAPGWGSRTREMYDWFRYRKMIIINTNTGQASVGAMGDAGPAEWTGKSFGASPEIMIHIGYSTGSRRGPVLMYFLDDPENKVPLGKIQTYTQPTETK